MNDDGKELIEVNNGLVEIYDWLDQLHDALLDGKMIVDDRPQYEPAELDRENLKLVQLIVKRLRHLCRRINGEQLD